MNSQYGETIRSQDVHIPFDPRIITPRIERPLRNNRYEAGEIALLRRVLRSGDRVLELGAGLGLCSAIAALTPDVAHVTTVEANPDLLPLIRETHRLNGVSDRVDLRHGLAAAQTGPAQPFYLRADFWASSGEPESRPFDRVEQVPVLGLNDLLAQTQANVLICDIEGAERDLFTGADLSGLRHIVLELHPRVYGPQGAAALNMVLESQGFYAVHPDQPGRSVQLFERRADVAHVPPPGSLTPVRPCRLWAQAAARPRVLITTCMKDEGPFILEWLAWHRAIGVTDFVVFTNDCRDGTDRILTHLAQKGALTHLPNPAQAVGSGAFQPVALAYTQMLPQFAAVDFVISADVDEFLNIRVGQGRLIDLFAATGPFDALSVSELHHGANGQTDFHPGWVQDQFPRHESETPGLRKSRRGVKTITRLSHRLMRLRNHRPDFCDAAVPPMWLDGSGRVTQWFHDDPSENGSDARGCYDLAVLDHYAVRSLGSFLVKTQRGDVVVPGKQVSLRYWRMRNRSEQATSAPHPAVMQAARDYHARHHQTDPDLMALHDAACDWHRDMIGELTTQPDYQERRDWILQHAWPDAAPTPT
ncbi:FkbM family methyltransferase [Paracoccus sp. (in: a-proteobacteria)]|uniref:FkbM family methyltransferase n=1 Tax=Paracoccus sp. TaxID=267 RepID=UPI0026DEECA8|nr:FkbM family methyltransferase [Paracoccus sp. (in: a-proteobacteria)]MDO5647482.1 FkbM family methyltransferase [Paracoccus sp. (in: a-proteobacteria)]